MNDVPISAVCLPTYVPSVVAAGLAYRKLSLACSPSGCESPGLPLLGGGSAGQTVLPSFPVRLVGFPPPSPPSRTRLSK